LVATKGKKELQLCGARAFVDARRLDRDESTRNEAWDSIQRGDLLTLEPTPETDGAVRVAKDCAVVPVVAVDGGTSRS
jgi:hypothetical protein